VTPWSPPCPHFVGIRCFGFIKFVMNLQVKPINSLETVALLGLSLAAARLVPEGTPIGAGGLLGFLIGNDITKGGQQVQVVFDRRLVGLGWGLLLGGRKIGRNASIGLGG
jgi:hypothetical protein